MHDITTHLTRLLAMATHTETSPEDAETLKVMTEWVDRLKKMSTAKLLSLETLGGKPEMTLEIAREMACNIVSAFKTLLDEGKAENCLECSISSQDGGTYLFTIVRPTGKSPLTLRNEAIRAMQEAESELAQARLQIDMDGDTINRIQECGHALEGHAGELSKRLKNANEFVWFLRTYIPDSNALGKGHREQAERLCKENDDFLAKGAPERPGKDLPSLTLTRFRWESFLEGKPRIQQVEFNTGLFIQIRDADLPPGYIGRTDPTWYPITELPDWVAIKLQGGGRT